MQNLWTKYSKYIGIAFTILVLWFFMSWFSDIVSWIVIAWILSLLGSPIMKFLGRFKIKKYQLPASLRALMVLVFFYAIFGLFFALFVPVIVQQGRNLAKVDYQTLMTSLEEPISHFNDWLIDKGLSDGEKWHLSGKDSLALGLNGNNNPEEHLILKKTVIHVDSILQKNGDTTTQTNIGLDIHLTLDDVEDHTNGSARKHSHVRSEGSVFEQIRKNVFQYFSPSQLVTKIVFYTVNLFGNFLVLISSVTFIAFFFLKDEELFGRVIKAAVPNQQTNKSVKALSSIKKLLTRYFSGIFVQISFITLYVYLLLSFFGVPNAFLIAFFAAVINVIPYLGPIIGAMFAILVTISSNLEVGFYLVTLPMIFKVLGTFASMQLIDGFILQPMIFSNSVKAHPLEIFLVVIIGAKVGGVTGMVIAIPLYTILRVIAAVFLKEFKIVQSLTKSIDDNQGLETEEEL